MGTAWARWPTIEHSAGGTARNLSLSTPEQALCSSPRSSGTSEPASQPSSFRSKRSRSAAASTWSCERTVPFFNRYSAVRLHVSLGFEQAVRLKPDAQDLTYPHLSADLGLGQGYLATGGKEHAMGSYRALLSLDKAKAQALLDAIDKTGAAPATNKGANPAKRPPGRAQQPKRHAPKGPRLGHSGPSKC